MDLKIKNFLVRVMCFLLIIYLRAAVRFRDCLRTFLGMFLNPSPTIYIPAGTMHFYMAEILLPPSTGKAQCYIGASRSAESLRPGSCELSLSGPDTVIYHCDGASSGTYVDCWECYGLWELKVSLMMDGGSLERSNRKHDRRIRAKGYC